MKPLLLFLSSCTALLAQPISVGIKGGVPLTDFIDAVSGPQTSVSTATKLYIVGPTVELRLPGGFGVEADALYRRFNYSSTATVVDAVTTQRTSGNDWEFPLLLKKRFLPGPVHPFIGAGVAFSKLSGVKQTIESVLSPNRITTTGSSNPAELKDDYSTGFVIGAGLDVRLLLLRITPEIRFTRWGTRHFSGIIAPGGSVNSNQSQAEFLVGFTF